jgi:hypothetical protein
MRYVAGNEVRLSTLVKDTTGTLVNPTGISLTIRKPDATTQTYSSPTQDAVGTYHQDIPPADTTQLGRYVAVWSFTGVGVGATTNLFDVYDPYEMRVITLDDAKGYGQIPLTDTAIDNELQGFIDTADEQIQKIIGGPILNTSVTERVAVGQNFTSLAVRQRLLVSVTSITDRASGVALPLTDIDVDTNSGVIRRNLGLPFFSRGGVYDVVYMAGFGTTVLAPFIEAAKIIVGHFWDTQHGPSLRPSFGGEETVVMPGMGFAIPNRAAELLSPYAVECYV